MRGPDPAADPLCQSSDPRTAAFPAAEVDSSEQTLEARLGQSSRSSSTLATDTATSTTMASTGDTVDGAASAFSTRSLMTAAGAGCGSAPMATLTAGSASATATSISITPFHSGQWEREGHVRDGDSTTDVLSPLLSLAALPSSDVVAAPATRAAAAAAASSSSALGGEEAAAVAGGRCRITVSQWGAVAMWSWGGQLENCAICKNGLAEVCVGCQTHVGPLLSCEAGVVGPAGGGGEERGGGRAPSSSVPAGRAAFMAGRCTLSWGSCSHVFHSHCISRWLAERKVCPLCGRSWELDKVTSND